MVLLLYELLHSPRLGVTGGVAIAVSYRLVSPLRVIYCSLQVLVVMLELTQSLRFGTELSHFPRFGVAL